MNIRKNKGITLVTLVITIVILLIISGISITGTITGKKETEESVQISELKIIQQAILERYTKVQLTKETLPGTSVTISEVQSIINEINNETEENINLKGKEYKRLNKKDLENLGVIGEEDNTYIVNYSTGEVINETIKTTNNGKALYIYAKSEK